MEVSGIICEYNPLHLGHKKQIDHLRSQGHGVVCVMSGNFVQRGHPAIFDKTLRAKAAVACGANLVIEMPLTCAISSAENFAAGGVAVLDKICNNICFGAENADPELLWSTAEVLLSSPFQENLHLHLSKGLSFPAARAAAVADCGLDANLLASPNNILAVEYCKAIIQQNATLKVMPIHRGGDYHDTVAHQQDPSATALRQLIHKREQWQDFIPEAAVPVFSQAIPHSLEYAQTAILYRLRTMSDAEFEALPYGSEGLWRKLMHASRRYTTLEQIIDATKSKRYTRTRIDRMILCAYLGITQQLMEMPVPYVRILAFDEIGRNILNHVKETGYLVNIGTKTGHDYELLEHRCGALYALTAQAAQPPDTEEKSRVFYRN